MGDCTFCSIIAGAGPVSVAYENATILAIMDIQPVNYGHVLVIPKKHAVYLADLDEETGVELFKVTMRVAEAVRNCGVECEGINLFLADGEAAGQEEFHVHMHVIPRYKTDNFGLRINYPARPTRKKLDEIAEKIRASVS